MTFCTSRSKLVVSVNFCCFVFRKCSSRALISVELVFEKTTSVHNVLAQPIMRCKSSLTHANRACMHGMTRYYSST